MSSAPHIVFAWELGAGYGHVAGVRPLLKRLLDKGFRVSVIARYLNTAASLLSELAIPVYQAPRWNGRNGYLDATYTYPEILLGFGYDCADNLAPMVKGWADLFDLIRPDLVLIDHGPTAVLACRCQQRRFVTFGTGFFLPPDVEYQPVFPGMPEPKPGRCAENESRVLDAVNGVLSRWQRERFGRFAELFHPGEHFLCTFPELDHFPDRSGANYLGARFDAGTGRAPRWPTGRERRVFAYVKEESRMFEAAWQALSALDANIIVHVPGPSATLTTAAERLPHLQLSPVPIRMDMVYREADLVVCHAGHGVISGALLGGRRLLLIPEVLEQNILTLLLTRQRLAMGIRQGDSAARLTAAMEAALQAPVLGAQAANFAKQYADFDQGAQMASLVETCRRLIG